MEMSWSMGSQRGKKILAGLGSALALVVLLAGGTAVTYANAAVGQKYSSVDQRIAPVVAAVTRLSTGRTVAGSGWQTYTGPDQPGLWIQVDTSSAGFTSAPNYVTSVGGYAFHWLLTGTSAVYPPDATLGGDLRRGFRIFVRYSNGAAITPNDAWQNQWYVQWIGAE